MPDMLVKLYELPEQHTLLASLAEQGITVRRAKAPEKHFVTEWVGKHFSPYWVSETEVSFARLPLSCFIATHEGKVVGFACYDATRRGFFGPTGVDDTYRGRKIGKALLLACLHDMLAQDYGYAIIGGVGPAEFYAGACGAVIIPDSTPGIYAGLLRNPTSSAADPSDE
ncbi:MAG: GNAT family N-acetyltransferase [Chloroflexi bacterium]|nr:GNAT family N-acetyltransferase [Chloroflexota bacterium]